MLSWPRGDDVIVVRVEGLPDRRGPYVEARDFYTDLSPARAPISADAALGWQDALLPEAFALA
ncbi:hypothetical protein [Sandarakinorhabdus sp.]|uniref:hypothetical protein n=1 Tax=Sandarakinorhabdus sp. TaxID=1916663 RepID=UPI00286E4054|nr:hypothetical protein [Sandarakinorhabdus sp.]